MTIPNKKKQVKIQPKIKTTLTKKSRAPREDPIYPSSHGSNEEKKKQETQQTSRVWMSQAYLYFLHTQKPKKTSTWVTLEEFDEIKRKQLRKEKRKELWQKVKQWWRKFKRFVERIFHIILQFFALVSWALYWVLFTLTYLDYHETIGLFFTVSICLILYLCMYFLIMDFKFYQQKDHQMFATFYLKVILIIGSTQTFFNCLGRHI
jgi:hypothetical protein